jgi:hypothetical protein
MSLTPEIAVTSQLLQKKEKKGSTARLYSPLGSQSLVYESCGLVHRSLDKPCQLRAIKISGTTKTTENFLLFPYSVSAQQTPPSIASCNLAMEVQLLVECA